MPGKSTEGFTKAAQRKKFVRHRDIKLSGKELNRESHILQKACEGVCRRCREKVQWRFQYDKYKPLSSMATCQNCKRKNVTKAYRTFCEPCASQTSVCESCCRAYIKDAEGNLTDETEKKRGKVDRDASGDISEDGGEDDDASFEAARRAAIFRSVCGGGGTGGTLVDTEHSDECTTTFDAVTNDVEEEDYDNNEEEDEEDDEEGEEKVEEEDMPSSSAALSVLPLSQLPSKPSLVWDERRFTHYASTKYSKARVVGSEVGVDVAISSLLLGGEEDSAAVVTAETMKTIAPK